MLQLRLEAGKCLLPVAIGSIGKVLEMEAVHITLTIFLLRLLYYIKQGEVKISSSNMIFGTLQNVNSVQLHFSQAICVLHIFKTNFESLFEDIH